MHLQGGGILRILVTGAAGFLGSHISRRLVADGHSVTGFDLSEGDMDIDWVEGDLRDPDQVERAVRRQDIVCHAGAVGDVYLAASNPRLASEVNVTGSANVASAAAGRGTRVVYASTWEVYGEPIYEPMDEDHRCQPDHPYSITKLAGEQMVLTAGHLNDFPALALRLGTAYGSGLRPNSVFRIFLDRARRGEPITIQGDGSQSRQFTHASDIAAAFSLACHSELAGAALNIVAGEPTTIKELADAVVARHPTEVSFGPSRPGDVTPAVVSADRAAHLLGWQAETSFEDGMAEFLAGS